MRALLNTAIKIVRQVSLQLVRSYDQLGPVEKVSQKEMTLRIQEQCFLEIQEEIQKARPMHKVQMAGKNIDAQLPSVWVVMPLVGANNFMDHDPNFFVAITYYELGQPKLSVLYDCLRNDLVTAVAGEGVVWNNKKMRVSAISKVQGLKIASQCPVGDKHNRQKQWASTYLKLAPFATNIDCQTLGLMSILKLVSAQVDIFLTYHISLETLQLGMLILKESGALVTDAKGGESIMETCTLMAANAQLVREVLQILKD
jgi:myo-inositol-1(or 4)-monophosphatase